MSIPPLVCSTPPPPDQCEDEKDPEDFDLHYNLSQEDDYDYGSFSTYNHFQSAVSVNRPLNDHVVDSTGTNNASNGDSTETVKNATDETVQWPNVTIENKLDADRKQGIGVNINNDLEIDFKNKVHIVEELNTEDKENNKGELHTDKKVNNEEELNVEDLNLTIDDESLSSIVKNGVYDNNADSDKSDSSDKEAPHFQDTAVSIITSDSNENAQLDEITVCPPSIDYIDDPQNSIDDLKIDEEECTDYTDIKNEPEPSFDLADPMETQVPETFKEVLTEVNNETDDEFGDFNDFHTISYSKPSTSVVVCDNPWETNQSDSDFGTFEAHFDDTENHEPQCQGFKTKVERSSPDGQLDSNVAEDDDDFGEFDDFKSSAQDTKDAQEIHNPPAHVPVLDFQMSESESQILENINKILNSIFMEDIPEPEDVFEGKLESHLCETWGHLLETDVRQPYIVNWNSSFGQKTLLKALCIDSRNILFGPKWSYNMPKYAANLSVAPLQPQKPIAPSGPNQTDVNSDRNATKTPGGWTDPFTSDGQESCNKENNAPELKRPTDLDVFDTALSTKSDRIYSSTLSVQPIRQISLPDTHIFTPTDSETPRSKTIHYGGSTVFLQSSMESEKKTADVTVETTSNNNVLDDSDYSDFQDFKGSFKTDALETIPAAGLPAENVEPPAIKTQLPSTSATYQVGILQPIKIEPIMPTLNWPSPGEVKETFDDFSEFASSTTWNNDSHETHTPIKDIEKTPQIDDKMNNTNIKNNEEPPNTINDSFDDDFDTFQSALPSNPPTQVAHSTSNFSNFVANDFSQNIPTSGTSSQEPELDFVFSKIDNKSEPISLSKPYNILNNSEPFILQNNTAISMPKVKESITKAPTPQLPGPPPSSAVLQPTVSSTQVQQNSTQILQPLSLESFSQINWPNPGINLQDLSRFNPVETLNSLKSDLSVAGNSKGASPVHAQKGSVQNPEDDIWGEFVSSKPKPQQSLPKKMATFADDDEWTDFVSSPTVKPQNGLNTISLNVHTNLSMQKTTPQTKQKIPALEIPITHYITPKSSNHSSYNDRHFQNL